jgi:hypothetical protein
VNCSNATCSLISLHCLNTDLFTAILGSVISHEESILKISIP